MADSKSQSSQTSNTSTTTIDRRIAADGNAQVFTADDGGSVTINQTADGAFDVVERSYETVENIFDGGTDLVRDLVRQTSTQSKAQSQQLAEITTQALQQSQSDQTELIQMALKIGGGLLSVYLIVRAFN